MRTLLRKIWEHYEVKALKPLKPINNESDEKATQDSENQRGCNENENEFLIKK